MIAPPVCAAVQWDFMAGSAVARHNIVSVTRVGAGSWDVLTSYVPRNTTLKARGDLAKILPFYSTQDSLYITAGCTLSGGKVLVHVAMATFGGIATDGDFSLYITEIP